MRLLHRIVEERREGQEMDNENDAFLIATGRTVRSRDGRGDEVSADVANITSHCLPHRDPDLKS